MPAFSQLSPKVCVSRYHDPLFGRCPLQNGTVGCQVHAVVVACVNRVVSCLSQAFGRDRRQGAINEESQSRTTSGNSRSRGASAANSMASRMSSRTRSGPARRISSGDMSLATMPVIVAAGIRMPRMRGTPPICAGFTVMRENFIQGPGIRTSGPAGSRIIPRQSKQREDCFQKAAFKRGLRRMRRSASRARWPGSP